MAFTFPTPLVLPVLLILAYCATPALSTCSDPDQIHCGGSDRCVRIRYICDGDNDCGDNTDEASSLCNAWRNSECERNSARCTRNGRRDCITIQNWCTINNPPCTGSLDMRLCLMLNEGKIRPLHTISLSTTTPAPTTWLDQPKVPQQPGVVVSDHPLVTALSRRRRDVSAPLTTLPSIHMTEETYTEEFEIRLSNTISHPDCPQLYTKVGDRCLSIFFIGNMTWLEARTFCKAIGGELLSLTNDLKMFSTLVQHLSTNTVTADFWVGGRFMNDSLGWTWLDDSTLPLGSPYWAVRHQNSCTPRVLAPNPNTNHTTLANDGACYRYTQAPSDPVEGHCVAITYEHYYYLSDQDCFAKKSPLCVKPGSNEPDQGL